MSTSFQRQKKVGTCCGLDGGYTLEIPMLKAYFQALGGEDLLKERGDWAVPFKGVFVPLPFLSVLSTATLSQGEQLSATMPFYVMFLFHRNPNTSVNHGPKP